jgi:hypothetical protein
MSNEHVCVVNGVRYVFRDKGGQSRKPCGGSPVDQCWILLSQSGVAGRPAARAALKAEPVEP